MTIKEYYQNGKKVGIGFDSIFELFAHTNRPDLLTPMTPIEGYVNDKQRKEMTEDPQWKEFYKKYKGV